MVSAWTMDDNVRHLSVPVVSAWTMDDNVRHLSVPVVSAWTKDDNVRHLSVPVVSAWTMDDNVRHLLYDDVASSIVSTPMPLPQSPPPAHTLPQLPRQTTTSGRETRWSVPGLWMIMSDIYCMMMWLALL